MNRKSLKIVHDIYVAIKSYVIYILIGSTYDVFIDCTNIVMVGKDFNEDFDIIDQPDCILMKHAR